VTFLEVQECLLKNLRSQIQNGHLTERGVARLTGVSQPHIHNVLKGMRSLTPKIADEMLNIFHLSVLDLISPRELQAMVVVQQQPFLLVELPVMRQLISSNTLWNKDFWPRERLSLPVPLRYGGSVQVAAARIQPDFRMRSVLGECDLTVADISEQTDSMAPDGLYVVRTQGGTAIRYLRRGATHLYLATADALDSPFEWERAPIADLASIVHARLLWIGREKNQRLPVHQRGRVLATTS
jgi:transcriptional regulator with XRE-family HTH domain